MNAKKSLCKYLIVFSSRVQIFLSSLFFFNFVHNNICDSSMHFFCNSCIYNPSADILWAINSIIKIIVFFYSPNTYFHLTVCALDQYLHGFLNWSTRTSAYPAECTQVTFKRYSINMLCHSLIWCVLIDISVNMRIAIHIAHRMLK